MKRFLACCFTVAWVVSTPAGDWPVLGGNPDHNWFVEEMLSFPLKPMWQRQGPTPDPAFRGLLAKPTDNETFTEDTVDHPVAGSGRIFIPSAREQTVVCLDAATGRELWVCFTEGPVRVSPTLHEGLLIVGADDGIIRALDAVTGAERWRIDKPPYPRRAVGNERLVSAWPVRSGVAVIDGIAYGARGCFSPYGAFVYAFDPKTGQIRWEKETLYAPQGRILREGEHLIVATGRTTPVELSIKDGQEILPTMSRRRGHGSTWVGHVAGLLCQGPTESGIIVIRVPGTADHETREVGLSGRFTGLKIRKLGADTHSVYLLEEDGLAAYERKAFVDAVTHVSGVKVEGIDKQQLRLIEKLDNYGRTAGGQAIIEDPRLRGGITPARQWTAQTDGGWDSLLVTAATVLVGGQDRVAAFDVTNGKEIWSSGIAGRAADLALSEGRLLVSTDTGMLYVFASTGTMGADLRAPASDIPALTVSSAVRAHAKAALGQADIDRGWCMILGGTPDPAALAAAIAAQSRFHVVVVERDAVKMQQMRLALRKAGLYGERVVVHHSEDGSLTYPHGFANLVIGDPSWSAKAVLRTVQPYGGTLTMPSAFAPTPAWQSDEFEPWEKSTTLQVAKRGIPEGAGEWSHIHANLGNTANSADRLVGTDVGMQWWGAPGPEDVVDRHALAMPPLFKAGKLVIPGKSDSLRCMDAYNGTSLWKVETPGAMRHWISHNAGYVGLSDTHAFVACRTECRMIDLNTGETVRSFPTPEEGKHWGYIGVIDGLLIGTVQETAASTAARGRKELIDTAILHSRVVVGKRLFVIDVTDGSTLWTKENASWLHPTITVDNGLLVAAESTNSMVLSDDAGAAHLPTFFQDDQARLAAYDLRTGKERWARPLKRLSDKYEHIMFLMASDGVLVSMRTGYVQGNPLIGYRFEAYNLADGEPLWQTDVMSDKEIYSPLSYGKNMQTAHPTIVNGKLYWLAHTFGTMFCHDLKTGKEHHDPEFTAAWQNKGCAPPSGSWDALYYRHTYTMQYTLEGRKQMPLLMIGRPACWMSIISGGGLILEPEAGSGCTCGLPMSISAALSPRDW